MMFDTNQVSRVVFDLCLIFSTWFISIFVKFSMLTLRFLISKIPKTHNTDVVRPENLPYDSEALVDGYM